MPLFLQVTAAVKLDLEEGREVGGAAGSEVAAGRGNGRGWRTLGLGFRDCRGFQWPPTLERGLLAVVADRPPAGQGWNPGGRRRWHVEEVRGGWGCADGGWTVGGEPPAGVEDETSVGGGLLGEKGRDGGGRGRAVSYSATGRALTLSLFFGTTSVCTSDLQYLIATSATWKLNTDNIENQC